MSIVAYTAVAASVAGPRDAMTLTLRHLNRATLARQMLLARKKTTLLNAVAQLVGVQAQMARPAFVCLWSRVQGATREKVAALLHDRTLVRATAMRATLHVTTASDYLAFRSCLQGDLDRGLKALLKQRLDGIEIERIVAIAREYFATPRTFDDMRRRLQTKYPKLDERAMGYAVRLTLPLVQVPTDDEWAYPAQASFVSAERWMGKKPAPDAGPDALVLRYLAAYGPATVADAQSWLGMQPLKPVFERLRPKLVSLRGPGKAELFDVPGAPMPDPDVPAPVRFLPEWDSMLIGRTDQRILAADDRAAVFLPGLRVLPTCLIDGFAAGTWKVERTKGAATLIVSPFSKVSKAHRAALEQEGEALLAFVEPDAKRREVRWGG
jgi:hypothetical protein